MGWKRKQRKHKRKGMEKREENEETGRQELGKGSLANGDPAGPSAGPGLPVCSRSGDVRFLVSPARLRGLGQRERGENVKNPRALAADVLTSLRCTSWCLRGRRVSKRMNLSMISGFYEQIKFLTR